MRVLGCAAARMSVSDHRAEDQAAVAQAIDCVRSDIRGMVGYTPGEQHHGYTKLNTNECPYPPSPRVLETLRGFSGEALRLYPDPISTKLRQTAARTYGVRPEQVLVGNGSDDCLTVLFRTFLNPGERVACPSPTYGLYSTLTTLQGGALVQVPYARSVSDWALPDALAGARAKLTFVANPNNPSATRAPVAQLRELARRVDGVLVIDEAYVDFATVEQPGASMLGHLDDHPNLVVLRTFSKSYSLAGARLGLLFAAAPLVAEMVKVKDSYNVNAISQALGVAALEDHAHHAELVRRTVEERQRLEAALGSFGWRWPVSQANFLLCEVGPRARELYEGLKSRRILVRWWNTPELAESLRITVGTPEQNDALLAALRDLVG